MSSLLNLSDYNLNMYYEQYMKYLVGFVTGSFAFFLITEFKKSLKKGENENDDDKNGNRKPEVNEVLFTNHLTQVCTAQHTKYSKDKIECTNPSCFMTNIKKIVNIIDNAKYSIDLCMYIFTAQELAKAVHRAKVRGIRIRIICDETMVHSSGSQVLDMIKAGIPARFESCSTMLMHHKFCVVDGSLRTETLHIKVKKDDESFIITGSTNWTFQGLGGNWDNLIISTNLALINQYEMEFQRIWNEFNKKGIFTGLN